MAYSIPLDTLNIYVNHFNSLKKAGLEFEVEQSSEYRVDADKGGYHEVILNPKFKNIKDVLDLAKIWQASRSPFKVAAITDFKGYENIYRLNNAEVITTEHYKNSSGSVKFIAQGVLAKLKGLSVVLLTEAPHELNKDKHTYRVCVSDGGFYHGNILYFANEEDLAYNYTDKGHILVSQSSSSIISPQPSLFVTDALTLDMNYIVALFSIFPEVIAEVIQHKAWLPSKDCRMTLLKLEKKLPVKYQAEYKKLKQQIQDDFSKNSCNVMIGKLTRNESQFIDLNGIRINKTRATYTAGNVSIEADNLTEVVFQKLNPNEEWDIFTLINIYTDWVELQFKTLPLNTDCTGFANEKSFGFKINDIPIKVSVNTDNTRRNVNGYLINVDELSAVMKRASCYLIDEANDNVTNYGLFLKNVARHSLRIRDIWANGLPVKTMFLDSDKGKYIGDDATTKHPKLRFVYKDKKGFYLLVNHYDEKDKAKKDPIKTNEYRIGKFAEFINKVQKANRSAYMGYYEHNYVRTHEGGWEPKPGHANPMSTALLNLLTTYAEGITEDDKQKFVGTVNYELSEAEKKSVEMLKDACDMTKAKPSERDGKKGYVVPGKMRTYFVEEDSLKVYDNDPNSINPYFCVVNKGEQGAGKDALVARLFALSNDQMLVKQITTLQRT